MAATIFRVAAASAVSLGNEKNHYSFPKIGDMGVCMTISISDDLVVRLGKSEVALSPRAGLRLAEDLARKAFRRALDEEAEKGERGARVSQRSAARC